MKFRYWTDEEKAILEYYYFTEGPKVAERLHGRTKQACVKRAKDLDLTTIYGLNYKDNDFINQYMELRKDGICKKYNLKEIPENNFDII